MKGDGSPLIPASGPLLPRIDLLDAVPAPLETGRLRPHVVRTPVGGRLTRRQRRVESRLAGGPLMALELVLSLLILALGILGIRDQVRCRRRRSTRTRALKTGRRTHSLVLTDRGVPEVVIVIRVVVGNTVPPICRVVQGQARKIQSQPQTSPPPRPVETVTTAAETAAKTISTAIAVPPPIPVPAPIPVSAAAAIATRCGVATTTSATPMAAAATTTVLRVRGHAHDQRGDAAAGDQG